MEQIASDERTCAAPGLAVLISRLAVNPHCRVLDLGPAVADNVAVLGPIAAQHWVVDCLREGNGATALHAVRAVCRVHKGLFDIVLAWDVLDHVEPDVAESFVRELFCCCRPGALLHAVVSSSERVSALPDRYRIIAPDRIAYQPATAERRIRPPLAPAEFEKRLAGFRVEHVVVLRHGVREFLAVKRPASAA